MNIINLTPHAITDCVTNTTFPPSGIVARVSSTSNLVGDVNGIPIHTTTFGDVIDLPAANTDTLYLVSGMVLDACKRHDLLAPGVLVRDAHGNPIGCNGFRKA